ncbi:MAG: hypothetical protein H6523_13370 [Mycolicibacterium sp.]|nr:hypothetical protein [Mycolicibacterium sp.]
MTESASPKHIAEIGDLAGIIGLESVELIEISGQRDDAVTSDHGFRMDVRSELAGASLVVGCRAEVMGAGGRYVADAEGTFRLSAIVTVDESVLLDFVERVGVMVIYPYLRAAVSDSAGRIGRKSPVLPLLRPGQVKLRPSEPEDDETSESPGNSVAPGP